MRPQRPTSPIPTPAFSTSPIPSTAEEPITPRTDRGTSRELTRDYGSFLSGLSKSFCSAVDGLAASQTLVLR
ncbi:unnamed protein product [Ectocarpus sp. 6 AP-2014]